MIKNDRWIRRWAESGGVNPFAPEQVNAASYDVRVSEHWICPTREPEEFNAAVDRFLAAVDRDTLLRWIAQGCPRGDDKDLPPPRQFDPSSWRIGKPDVVLSMADAFDVPARIASIALMPPHWTISTN